MNISAKTTVKITSFRVSGKKGVALFTSGLEVHFPLRWFPRLAKANPEQLNHWQLIGSGTGLHWPELDEDISAEGLLQGKKSFEYRPFSSPLQADKLKEIRCSLLQMTQKELGRALGYSEVAIRHLEKGRNPITPRFETALAALL